MENDMGPNITYVEVVDYAFHNQLELVMEYLWFPWQPLEVCHPHQSADHNAPYAASHSTSAIRKFFLTR